jgi:hypothetical protein
VIAQGYATPANIEFSGKTCCTGFTLRIENIYQYIGYRPSNSYLRGIFIADGNGGTNCRFRWAIGIEKQPAWRPFFYQINTAGFSGYNQ